NIISPYNLWLKGGTGSLSSTDNSKSELLKKLLLVVVIKIYELLDDRLNENVKFAYRRNYSGNSTYLFYDIPVILHL
ncbi:MAG TPA: hypothetical protein VE378_06890, partial [Nitrososphaeraceae archaeon]|nr:hypothetical protein [Nitrososphaeraceae archaeon]